MLASWPRSDNRYENQDRAALVWEQDQDALVFGAVTVYVAGLLLTTQGCCRCSEMSELFAAGLVVVLPPKPWHY